MNRRGLWLAGCALLLLGGGFWWIRDRPNEEGWSGNEPVLQQQRVLIGTRFDRNPAPVRLQFHNTTKERWRVQPLPSGCGGSPCGPYRRLRVTPYEVEPGGTLQVEAELNLQGYLRNPLPISVEEELLIGVEQGEGGKKGLLIAEIRGVLLEPLPNAPEQVWISWKPGEQKRRYEWALHPQLKGKPLSIQTDLPFARAYLEASSSRVVLEIGASSSDAPREGRLTLRSGKRILREIALHVEQEIGVRWSPAVVGFGKGVVGQVAEQRVELTRTPKGPPLNSSEIQVSIQPDLLEVKVMEHTADRLTLLLRAQPKRPGFQEGVVRVRLGSQGFRLPFNWVAVSEAQEEIPGVRGKRNLTGR